MASTEPNAAETAPDTNIAPTEDIVVNLQIVSPSSGVNGPLLFPSLPVATTVKQLKARIREALPQISPRDDNQRLIFRGRALARESESLQDVMGNLSSGDQQTMHLVLKNPGESRSSSLPPPPTPSDGPLPRGLGQPRMPTVPPGYSQHGQFVANGRQASPAPGQPRLIQAQFTHSAFTTPPPTMPGMPRETSIPPSTAPFAQGRMPSPSPNANHTPEQAAAFQQQHQGMAQWLTQIHRDATARALHNQPPRGRTQVVMRGIAHGANPQSVDAQNRRASPASGAAVHREVITQNGQTYHVETTVRSSAGGAGPSIADVQNIIRGADSNHSAQVQAMAGALQRSASVQSRSQQQSVGTSPTPPVSTATMDSRTGGEGAAPESTSQTAPTSTSGISTSTSHAPAAVPRPAQEVYILSSPEGPRALLINSATAETFFTPRLGAAAGHSPLRAVPSLPSLLNDSWLRNRNDAPHTQHQPPQNDARAPGQAPAVAAPGNPPVQAAGQMGLGHPANPVVGGLGQAIMQAWEHTWLLLRLAVFVWMLITPGASWTQWITILGAAAFVFALSTGMLSGVTELVWRPIARHVEGILPRIDQHGRPNVAPPADERRIQGPDAAGPAGQQPEPAQMAARLVQQQRRDRETWIMTQVRRMERAGLLFLASIAPGVAEGHIANLEREAREAREARRRAEAAAAERAEREAEAARDGAAEGEGTEASGDGADVGERAVEGGEEPEPAGNQGNPEPLIAI